MRTRGQNVSSVFKNHFTTSSESTYTPNELSLSLSLVISWSVCSSFVMHCHISCTCSVQALVSGEVSPCERHFGQKHQHVSIFVVVLGRWVLFSLVWSPTRRFSCRLCLCNLLFLSNVDVCHLFHSASFAESPVVSMIHVISVRQRANSITALTWELTVSCSELLQHLLLLVTLAQKVRRASRQISKTLNRSSCFPLCFQTKIPLFVCAERHSQHTHTNTHTHSWLRIRGHLGLGLEAMTGRWRRDYSASLVSDFLPPFVCTSWRDEEEEEEKIEPGWMSWPDRLLRYWKTTKEEVNRRKAEKQHKWNCCRLIVDDLTQLAPNLLTDDDERQQEVLSVCRRRGATFKHRKSKDNNANCAYAFQFRLVDKLFLFISD